MDKARNLITEGEISLSMLKYKKAIEQYTKGYEILKQIYDESGERGKNAIRSDIERLLNSLGLAQMLHGEYQDAIDSYNKSLFLFAQKHQIVLPGINDKESNVIGDDEKSFFITQEKKIQPEKQNS